ncbi:glycosyltransferase [Vibrio splendidus]
MKKAIVLTKNFETYRSGYYHQDLVDALINNLEAYVYGPGYNDYNKEDSIDDVILKSPFETGDIDYIIMSTSWDDDESTLNVDPHPNIKLKKIENIKKIYFLNKEYKKLELRFEYCKNNAFDVIYTVHPNARLWSLEQGLNIEQLHFGINLERFKHKGEYKSIDFAFTGSLHSSHLDYRTLVKKEIFRPERLHTKSNKEWRNILRAVIQDNYKKHQIYWAEFGARDILGRNLLPFGDEYGSFLKKTTMMLNTPSAVGIFNTRFFELMASKTLILCPRCENYNGLLIDKVNCLMYEPNMSDFYDVFSEGINNIHLRNKIVKQAYDEVLNHTYDVRVKSILT